MFSRPLNDAIVDSVERTKGGWIGRYIIINDDASDILHLDSKKLGGI